MASISILPSEIFINIFTKLPIKSLCHCTRVCKTWRHIVFDPYFIKIRFSTTDPSLILHTQSFNFNGFSFDDLYLLEGQNCDNLRCSSSTLSNSFKDRKFDVVGSCNGLVCLSNPSNLDPVCVCNPLTGEYVFLPQREKLKGDWQMVSGFGFDCRSNKYKVLTMRYIIKKNPVTDLSLYRLEGEIHTVGSGEGWRSVGDARYPLRPGCLEVLLNGAFHWVMNENSIGMDDSEVIVSFKIDDEIFVPIPPPEELDRKHQYRMELGVLECNLCIFDYFVDAYIEIWMMMDYGVKDSWTKKFTLTVGLGSKLLKPVSIMENGKMLLVLEGYERHSLVSFDPVREVVTDIVTDGLPCKFKAISHVGTLASLRDVMEDPKRLS